MSKAPDRGSFPLDHFHECDDQAKAYSNCILKHELMPKRCRDWQIKYLQCRMKSGLMEQQQVKKLGFLPENSWETEQAEKRALYQQIIRSKQRAWKVAMEREKKRYEEQKKKESNVKFPE